MLADVIHDDTISIEALAEELRVPHEDLMRSLGLSPERAHETTLLESSEVQGRLYEMGDILLRADEWLGSQEETYGWYREAFLPGFEGRTAEMLVLEGRGNAVRRYLDEVAEGGFG